MLQGFSLEVLPPTLGNLATLIRLRASETFQHFIQCDIKLGSGFEDLYKSAIAPLLDRSDDGRDDDHAFIKKGQTAGALVAALHRIIAARKLIPQHKLAPKGKRVQIVGFDEKDILRKIAALQPAMGFKGRKRRRSGAGPRDRGPEGQNGVVSVAGHAGPRGDHGGQSDTTQDGAPHERQKRMRGHADVRMSGHAAQADERACRIQ